jgi:hypothetical protein
LYRLPISDIGNFIKYFYCITKAGGLGFLGTGGQNPNTKVKYIGVGDIVSKLHQAQKEAESTNSIGVGLNIQGCLDKVYF